MSLPALDNLVRIGQHSEHQKRNLAEYEGYLEIEESTVAELCNVVASLIADVQSVISQGATG